MKFENILLFLLGHTNRRAPTLRHKRFDFFYGRFRFLASSLAARAEYESSPREKQHRVRYGAAQTNMNGAIGCRDGFLRNKRSQSAPRGLRGLSIRHEH